MNISVFDQSVLIDCNSPNSLTSLAVGFALLHVKGLVPDGSLAGCTLETLHMVGHLQGVHDLLRRGGEAVNISRLKPCEWATSLRNANLIRIFWDKGKHADGSSLVSNPTALTPVIFFLHLAQLGAYRLSWHLVQKTEPLSSKKPPSSRTTLHCEHVNSSGCQDRPSATRYRPLGKPERQ